VISTLTPALSQREREKSLPIKYFYKINIGSSLSFKERVRER